MRSVILGGLTAALLQVSALPAAAPAMAASVKPPALAQLREALLTPEDLGGGYTVNTKRNREALGVEAARTKKCVAAVKALKPVLRSKAASFIEEEDKPSGVKQFVISGTPAALARWENAGKVMVRDCVRAKADTKGAEETVTKLSIGAAGDWAYGIRYRKTVPEKNISPIHASDVVLIRVENTVTLLVSDGFFSTFDPGLSRRAARLAVPKLKDVQ
jgi:hypothetical protein